MLADLTHVAYAILARADGVVTWDSHTLAREKVRRAVQAYCRSEDCPAPVIGTPEEVVKWLELKPPE